MRDRANGPKLDKVDAKFCTMRCLKEGHQSGGQVPRGRTKDEDDDDNNDRALEWGSRSWLY